MSSDDHPGDLPEKAGERLPDPPEPREGRAEIEEVDDLNKRRSLERLQHRRDVVSEAKDRVIQAELETPGARQRVTQMYREAIVSAIAEFKPWFVNDDLDLDTDYWNGVPIGEHTESPPDVLVNGAASTPLGSPIRIVDPATESDVAFVGLRDIWEAPRSIPFQFTARFEAPIRKSRIGAKINDPAASIQGDPSERAYEATVIVNRTIPIDVLHEAAASLAEFSQEIGIDAKLDEAEGLGKYS